MTGSVGGFEFSNNYDPKLDPDDGAFPEPEDTSFDIDEFERAASEASGAASSSQPSGKPPSKSKRTRKKPVPPPAQNQGNDNLKRLKQQLEFSADHIQIQMNNLAKGLNTPGVDKNDIERRIDILKSKKDEIERQITLMSKKLNARPSNKKAEVPAPIQKKIPYHASYKDVPPNKYIESYEEAEKWIEAIENDERNVVGGSKAFYSGYATELTEPAKKVIKRLDNVKDKFSRAADKAEKAREEARLAERKKTPKASQHIEEYIPEGKEPLSSYKPGDTFSPASSQSPPPSSSGSGSGTPPNQPPAPPGFPPDDHSDYPQGQHPEDPNDPNNNKPDIINQISDVPSDKKIKEDQAKNLASAKKQFKDFIREEKDKFAREFRDERLSLNREVQKLNAEAVARKTEINRASSDAKTAIYSLSAGVGLPGYIVASVADALVIQPAVREDVQAEQKHQRDLRDYKNESVDISNARKDAFREYTKSQEFSDLPEEVKTQFAETGKIPEGSIPSFEEWADKTGASSAFNKQLNPPSQPGPGKAGAITSMLGKAGPIATAVVEGINLINANTHRLGTEYRGNISSSLSKEAIPALSDKAQSFSRMSDPLQIIGMESPSHAMFQEAVDTFESAVKEFEGFAREDLGFSPGALSASIDGSIMRLEQSMRIAEQTDPQKEAMIRVTDEIGLVWNEFRSMFFTTFAPLVVAVLTVIKVVLQAILDTVNFIKNLIIKLIDIVVTIMEYLAMIIPGLALHAHVARQILNELKKSKATPSGLKQILDDFHNPNNQPVKPPKPGNFR